MTPVSLQNSSLSQVQNIAIIFLHHNHILWRYHLDYKFFWNYHYNLELFSSLSKLAQIASRFCHFMSIVYIPCLIKGQRFSSLTTFLSIMFRGIKKTSLSKKLSLKLSRVGDTRFASTTQIHQLVLEIKLTSFYNHVQ